MVTITLSSKEANSYLVKLLGLLAEAIAWVWKQKKQISFEVPDEYAKNRTGAGGSCLRWEPPRGATEAEILIGILRRMR